MHIQTSDQQDTLELGFSPDTCNWGTHICGLYETEQERDDILMRYLHQGDIDNELIITCPAEQGEESFRNEYSSRYPECSNHLHDHERFIINDVKAHYFPKGDTFSVWDMEDALEDANNAIQQNGHRNVRAATEMTWALDALPGTEDLMAYESRLKYFFQDKPWVCICLYNISKFSGSMVMDVLRTHPYTISGGVLTANPFYHDPEVWLAKHAPEYLTRPS